MLLALDTSTPAVTAALHDGVRVVAESTVVDARRHGELLAPAIAAVLSAAGVGPGALTRIAVGVGPGPFTGLRVGVVTALTMGAALDVPVLGVCSLGRAGARSARRWRRRRFRGGHRRATARGLLGRVRRDRCTYGRTRGGPARPSRGRSWPRRGRAVLGPATDLYPFEGVLPSRPLSAGALAELVAGGRAELLPVRPLYLRRPDATPPGQRKPVLA